MSLLIFDNLRKPGFDICRIPGPSKIPDGLAIPVKHIVAIQASVPVEDLQFLQNLTVNINRPAFLVFCLSRIDPYQAFFEVNLIPGQI